jgi:hypothetical protein
VKGHTFSSSFKKLRPARFSIFFVLNLGWVGKNEVFLIARTLFPQVAFV